MTTPEEKDAGRGFLQRCVAGTSANVAVETIRERGTEVVLAVYRLVKIGLIHAFDNAAVGQTLDQTLGIIHEFSGLAGGTVTVTFVDDTVFVCGQLLRGSRSVFESAAELGELLLRCGVSELRFETNMTRADLKMAAQALSGALRDSGGPKLPDVRIPNIAMLKVDTRLAKGATASGRRHPLDYYASALIVLRKFFDELAAGTTVLPHRVKRIAQGLVGLADTEGSGLLGLTALAGAHRDDAGRALQAAIVAIAIGRELTDDRATIARLAMAALLADVGRVRLAGQEGRNRLVHLDDPVDRQVPAMTGAISIGTSGVNAQSALHTVVVYEATWMEREAQLGPVYGGATPPLLHAKVVYLARAMLDLLAPRDNKRALSVLDAIEALTRDPKADRTLLRLLLKAVGVNPVGSIIELETGEWAVVVGPSSNPKAPDRPVVRIVVDRAGAVIEPPQEVDLGSPAPGTTYPRIVRNVPREEARFNSARALV